MQYCPLIVRETNGAAAGQLSRIITPTVNLGRLDVQGVDFTAHYNLPETALGQFSIHALFTYLKQYKSQSAPGEAGDVVASSAGTMAVAGTAAGSGCPDVSSDGGTCYLPRIQGQTTLYWNRGPWSASWQMQVLGGFHISDDPYNVRGLDHYGATVYNDASITYDAESIHTTFSFGINNIGNRQPPLLYSNRVEEFNTDTDNFDVYGRYYWASAAVTF
jgi:outer membrane receptor protein involved in Fe transport